MIIDAWAQHPTLRQLQEPMFESLRRWGAANISVTQEPPIADTLAQMDTAGVGKAILSAWVGPQGELISNDEVAACVAAAPDRLYGVGSVDIRKPMQAQQEIRRCVDELGFVGIRVLPWLWELPPTHALFYPIYAMCCKLSIPFCTQIGHTGPLMSSEVGRPIYLDRVALDFPELVIVGGHIGYPWTDEAIAVATKHKNVYIDTSAYTIGRYPPQIVEYLKTHGRSKILFGSNYPMIKPADALKGLESLNLDSEIAERFLASNAQSVYGLA